MNEQVRLVGSVNVRQMGTGEWLKRDWWGTE